jgi:hypothetical protein
MFFFRTIFKITYQGSSLGWGFGGLGLEVGLRSLLTTRIKCVFQHFLKKRNIQKKSLFFNYTTVEPPNPNLQTTNLQTFLSP